MVSCVFLRFSLVFIRLDWFSLGFLSLLAVCICFPYVFLCVWLFLFVFLMCSFVWISFYLFYADFPMFIFVFMWFPQVFFGFHLVMSFQVFPFQVFPRIGGLAYDSTCLTGNLHGSLYRASFRKSD